MVSGSSNGVQFLLLLTKSAYQKYSSRKFTLTFLEYSPPPEAAIVLGILATTQFFSFARNKQQRNLLDKRKQPHLFVFLPKPKYRPNEHGKTDPLSSRGHFPPTIILSDVQSTRRAKVVSSVGAHQDIHDHRAYWCALHASLSMGGVNFGPVGGVLVPVPMMVGVPTQRCSVVLSRARL